MSTKQLKKLKHITDVEVWENSVNICDCQTCLWKITLTLKQVFASNDCLLDFSVEFRCLLNLFGHLFSINHAAFCLSNGTFLKGQYHFSAKGQRLMHPSIQYPH